jgi:exosome complex RNA-binding protein Csl4
VRTQETHDAGTGTHVRSGTIFAAIVGTQTVDTSEAGRPTVSVRGRAAAPVVPEPGSIVVARVRALQPSCVCVRAHVRVQVPADLPALHHGMPFSGPPQCSASCR